VFSDFVTINGDLFGCIAGTAGTTNVPCIFHTDRIHPAGNPDNPALTAASEEFSAGNPDAALQLAKTVLQKNSGDVQANYLARVFEREKISRLARTAQADSGVKAP
jgi:hypothetical protein